MKYLEIGKESLEPMVLLRDGEKSGLSGIIFCYSHRFHGISKRQTASVQAIPYWLSPIVLPSTDPV